MEKEMATHSSILAWKNPWTEESGGLKSMGLHYWACVHEGGGRWVGSNKLVELKNKNHKVKLSIEMPSFETSSLIHLSVTDIELSPLLWELMIRTNNAWDKRSDLVLWEDLEGAGGEGGGRGDWDGEDM